MRSCLCITDLLALAITTAKFFGCSDIHLVINMKKDLMQFLRFIVVGGAATLAHFFLAMLLCLFFKSCCSMFFLNIMAFSVAFAISYLGHRYITFCKRGSFPKFFLTSLSGFAINNLVLFFMIWLGLYGEISLLFSILIVPFITYLLSRFWVFGEQNEQQH